jgi:hypothetical protein
MGNSRIIINTVEDTLVSTSSTLPLEIGIVLKSPKGQIGVPIKVTTEAELIEQFGTPTTSYPVLDAVKSFLKVYGGITISRLKFSVDGIASSAELDNEGASASVDITGKSFSDFENGFSIIITEATANDLTVALYDASDALLESIQVAAAVADFVSDVNSKSTYLQAALKNGATGNVDAQTVDMANGVVGSQYVLQDVLDAIAIFDSPMLGRVDIITAPGLAEFESPTSWETWTANPASTAWVTGTLYTVATKVNIDGSIYACATEHTSGTFATDLAAVKWTLVQAISTYSVDDLVINSGTKYTCITAHTAGTTFTAGNFEATSETEEVVKALIEVTDSRQEAIALVDFVEDKPVADVVALFGNEGDWPMSSKIVYYHPGVKMRLSSGSAVVVPAAMAALFVHAAASRISRWASPAGFTSVMAIPYVSGFYKVLKQAEIDTLYNIDGDYRPAVNPIVFDNSVGWVIDGQRTATIATDIRRSLSIEKLIDEITFQTNINSKKYQYKPNNQTTWDSWKLDMTTYLNGILTDGGISSFQVFMGMNTMTNEDIQNGLLVGVIKLVPVFTIEEIQITINVNLEA